MVVGVGQLRQPVDLLAVFRPLVDPRIEIDQMHAGRAGGREVDDDIALAVEAAGISHVGVVVGRHVDVVVVGPADALQMNRHRACRPAPRSASC